MPSAHINCVLVLARITLIGEKGVVFNMKLFSLQSESCSSSKNNSVEMMCFVLHCVLSYKIYMMIL